MLNSTKYPRLRFGAFIADLNSFELFKHGIRVRLQHQPFQILKRLLESGGEVVTRDELRLVLWTESTFVDFDAGVNAAVRRLRDSLNDSAEEPRYIETLPRSGYRFIAEIEVLVEKSMDLHVERPETPIPLPMLDVEPPRKTERNASFIRRGLVLWFSILVAASVILLTIAERENWQRRLFPSRSVTGIQSIAVLPLQNLSGDATQDYFADGVTDALITNLAQIESLKVISNTSSVHYKGTSKTTPEIAKELGVDAVVEGAIERSGEHVRITTQLIEARTDRHLWAKSYEMNASDIFALEANVARDVVSQVHELTPQEKKKLTVTRSVAPAAFEDFMLGQFYQNKRTSQGLHKSIECFEKALAINPQYAEAYAGLAQSYDLLIQSVAAEIPDYAGGPKAKAAALKALELDPYLGPAHAALGFELEVAENKPTEAAKEYLQAIQLEPNSTMAYLWLSDYLGGIGKKDDALDLILRAQRVDPLNPNVAKVVGECLWSLNRQNEAVVQFEKAVELDPTRFNTRMDLADLYFELKRYSEAFEQYQKSVEISKGGAFASFGLAVAYHKLGKDADAESILSKMKDKERIHPFQDAYFIAMLSAVLGQEANAMHWLERACQHHSPGYRNFVEEEAFRRLHTNPRFIALAESVKRDNSHGTNE